MGSATAGQSATGRGSWRQQWQSLSPGARTALSTTAVAGVALLAQLSTFNRSIVPMDEGHLSAVAAGLLQGKLLYRDLHTGIFPGVYYTAALLFSVFGEDFIVTRWAQVAVNTAIALCLWRLADRAVRSVWALLPPLLYLALIPFSFPVLTMLNYSTLSVCLALAALLFLLRYLEAARRLDAVALGLLLAAAALTKQNFGGLAFVAIGIGLVWGRPGSALAQRSWISGLWPILASGGAAGLAALGYFAASGNLSHLIESTLLSLESEDGQKGERYCQAGLTIADTLLGEPHLSTDREHQGLLLHSIYHRPNGWDYVPPGKKIPCGESCMWGDYHLMELGVYIHRLASNGIYHTFYLDD